MYASLLFEKRRETFPPPRFYIAVLDARVFTSLCRTALRLRFGGILQIFRWHFAAFTHEVVLKPAHGTQADHDHHNYHLAYAGAVAVGLSQSIATRSRVARCPPEIGK